MRILMVLTSHTVHGLARPTSELSLEDLSVPYCTFMDANFQLVIASPAGGAPPFAPRTQSARWRSDSGYFDDREARAVLADSIELSRVSASDFQAVYYAGGLGAVVDLRGYKPSQDLISSMIGQNRPVGLIGPAVAALLDVQSPDGESVINDRRITGMTLSEYRAASVGVLAPVSVEEEVVGAGGIFCHRAEQACHIESDANVVTGQNRQSAGHVAREIVRLIADGQKPSGLSTSRIQ